MERDALNGEGLYSNTTQIAEHPDEALDELFGVEVYNVACSLQPYHSELRQYGVTGVTLGTQPTRQLFEYLKRIADHIKANTDKPEAVKANILEAITNLDKLKHWGLIYQILILQGLLVMLANCSFADDDRGYIEAQCLFDWIADLLVDKVMWFAMTGGVKYGDGDKERLQPLCDYLYNTEIGRCVQDCIFDRTQPEADHLNPDTSTPTDSPEVVSLPDELNTPEARALFSELVKQGFAESNGAVYRWKSTNALFGYMVNQVSERLNIRPDNDRLPWAIFQCAFGMSNAQIRTATNHQSKLNNGAVNEPTGYEKIKTICK